MKILREHELLDLLNSAPGVSLERRAFGRHIRPLMVERGEARQAAEGRTQPYVYDATDMWQWLWYLAVRAELIRRGTWSPKRKYSLRDLEDIALMEVHDDVLSELFPLRGQGG